MCEKKYSIQMCHLCLYLVYLRFLPSGVSPTGYTVIIKCTWQFVHLSILQKQYTMRMHACLLFPLQQCVSLPLCPSGLTTHQFGSLWQQHGWFLHTICFHTVRVLHQCSLPSELSYRNRKLFLLRKRKLAVSLLFIQSQAECEEASL